MWRSNYCMKKILLELRPIFVCFSRIFTSPDWKVTNSQFIRQIYFCASLHINSHFRNHVENGPSHAGHGNSVTGTLRDKLNPPPPDLWIGHDQLELKDLSDEASALSAICDETGETTLTRSIMSNEPDYRATMERTRNYIQNSQYSGKLIILGLLNLVEV